MSTSRAHPEPSQPSGFHPPRSVVAYLSPHYPSQCSTPIASETETSRLACTAVPTYNKRSAPFVYDQYAPDTKYVHMYICWAPSYHAGFHNPPLRVTNTNRRLDRTIRMHDTYIRGIWHLGIMNSDRRDNTRKNTHPLHTDPRRLHAYTQRFDDQ